MLRFALVVVGVPRGSRLGRNPLHDGDEIYRVHLKGQGLCDRLHGTTQFSRPFVPTALVRTGPHAHDGDGQFTANARPSLDWFGFVGLTFWAGHGLSFQRKNLA